LATSLIDPGTLVALADGIAAPAVPKANKANLDNFTINFFNYYN